MAIHCYIYILKRAGHFIFIKDAHSLTKPELNKSETFRFLTDIYELLTFISVAEIYW